MSKWVPSQAIVEKTALAVQLIETLDPLILRRNLVPIPLDKLDELENKCGVKLPPDYKYWVATVGTGFIDLIFGSVSIWSIYEIWIHALHEKHAQYTGITSYVTPLVWNYSGNPHGYHISGIAMTDDGLCPVIKSVYAQYDGVLSPSWPHYIIAEILDRVRKVSRNALSGDQRNIIDKLSNSSINDIDASHDALCKSAELRARNTYILDTENPEILDTRWSKVAWADISSDIIKRSGRADEHSLLAEINEENEWIVFEDTLCTANLLVDYGFSSLSHSELGRHLHLLLENLPKYDNFDRIRQLLQAYPWREVRERV